ncbi:MAG: hypothetical protein U0790_00205 [Isosphaeraceae bacterium]
MGKLAEAYVELSADDAKLDAELEQQRGKLEGWSRETGGLVAAALGGFIAGGLTEAFSHLGDYLQEATKKAADLAESTAKVGETFGPGAAGVEAFADTMAAQYGLIKREVLDAASSFGLVTQGMGMAERESGRLSTMLVKTAADLASFHNLSNKEVLDKLRSGMSGEMEPLRILGINLSESNVQANAFALGLVKAGEELSEYAKAVSRADLIQKQAAKALGDLDRTYDSLSNRQKRLAGDMENLQTSIGQALVDPTSEAIGLVYDLAEAFTGLGDGQDAVKQLGENLKDVVDILRAGLDDFGAFEEIFLRLSASVFGDTFGDRTKADEMERERERKLGEKDQARRDRRTGAGSWGGSGDPWNPGDADRGWRAGEGSATGRNLKQEMADEKARAKEEARQAKQEAADEKKRARDEQAEANRLQKQWDAMRSPEERYRDERAKAFDAYNSGQINGEMGRRLIDRGSGIDRDIEKARERILDLTYSERRDPGRVLGDLASSHNALQNQALDDTQRQSLETAQKQLEALLGIREDLIAGRPDAYQRLERQRAVIRGRE